MQPGQVIRPQSTDDPQPAPAGPQPDRPEEEPEENPQPAPTPGPGSEPAAAEQPQSAPAIAAEAAHGDLSEPPAPEQPDTGWQFRPSTRGAQQSLPADITWTASEFISHEKNAGWYGALIVVGAVVAAGDYVLTKDWLSAGVIAFATVAFAALSARKPRTQQYALTHQGLQIGNKAYFFQDFKNFSITEEGAIASVVFMPLKRFMPPLTIYLTPDMEDQVVGFLSQVLPFEQHRADAVDSLMRRIRF